MAEFINTTYFIILSSLVYLYVITFMLANLNKKARMFYLQLPEKLFEPVRKKIPVFLGTHIILNIKKILTFFFRLLAVVSAYFGRFDAGLAGISELSLNEALDYCSLSLRRLYTENFQLTVVYCSLAIVVFYFILSIF